MKFTKQIILAAVLLVTAACDRGKESILQPTKPSSEQPTGTFYYVQSADNPLLAMVPLGDSLSCDVLGTRNGNGDPERIEGYYLSNRITGEETYVQLDDMGRVDMVTIEDGSWLEIDYGTDGEPIRMTGYSAASGEIFGHQTEDKIATALAWETPSALAAPTDHRSLRFVCGSGNPVNLRVKNVRAKWTHLDGEKMRVFFMRSYDDPSLFYYELPGDYRYLDGGDVDCDRFADNVRGISASRIAGSIISYLCAAIGPTVEPYVLCQMFADRVGQLSRIERYNFCREVVTAINDVGDNELLDAGTVEVGFTVGTKRMYDRFTVDLADDTQYNEMLLDVPGTVGYVYMMRSGDLYQPHAIVNTRNYCWGNGAMLCGEAVPTSAAASTVRACVPVTGDRTRLEIGPLLECVRYNIRVWRSDYPGEEEDRVVNSVRTCSWEARMDPDRARGGGYLFGGSLKIVGGGVEGTGARLEHEQRDSENLPGWQKVWIATGTVTVTQPPEAGCEPGGGRFFHVSGRGFQDVKAWDSAREDYVHPTVRGTVTYQVVDRPGGDVVKMSFAPDASDPNSKYAVSGKLCEFTVTSGDVLVELADQDCK